MKYVINPLTNRKISVGGRTYKQLIKMGVPLPSQRFQTFQTGGAPNMYKKMLSDAKKSTPTIVTPSTGEKATIAQSKYHLMNSGKAPNPSTHSWYHYHAPFSQNFGDYVCLKRSTLKDLGTFLKDAFAADISGIKTIN